MSIILAKFLGIYFLVVGVALLMKPEQFRVMYREFFNNSALLWFGAIFALLLGALIVSVHNVWVVGWPVFITILGWWAVIKGTGLLIYPELMERFRGILSWSPNTFRIMGGVWTAIGLLLTYAGWMQLG